EALDGNYETLMKKGKEENSLFSSEKLKESTEVAEVSKKREIPEVFNLMSGASVRKKPKNKPTAPSAVDAAGAAQEAKEEIKPSTVGPIPADNGNETVQGKAFENGKPSIEVVTLSDDDDDIVMNESNTITTTPLKSSHSAESKLEQSSAEDSTSTQKKKPIDIFSQLSAKKVVVHSPPVNKKEKVEPTLLTD
ncbi:hypothetical protein WICPIJ_003341, partial [Wickerhamomyces pijperi]